MKTKNNQQIDYLTKLKYSKLALTWCKQYFGKNNRKKRKLLLKPKKNTKFIKRSKVFGLYCFYRNTIYIYLNNCDSIDEIISTIIHEYTHYLQPSTKYMYYQSVYNYTQNPFEIEAKRNEEKCLDKCLNYIISKSETSLKNKKKFSS